MVNKKRLIDANKLSEQMAVTFEQCVYDGVDSAVCQIALDTISEASAVDAVEVVRCKDCKHRVYNPHSADYWCNHTLGLCSEVYDTDFCSYGERRHNNA